MVWGTVAIVCNRVLTELWAAGYNMSTRGGKQSSGNDVGPVLQESSSAAELHVQLLLQARLLVADALTTVHSSLSDHMPT